MDWNDLRVFLIAVRSGSYTAAAAPLEMNRTTVGRRVAALEAALNVTLFREGPLGPEPTEEGRLVLSAASKLEGAVAELRAQLNQRAAEPITIRIASSAGIATEFLDLLADFQQQRGRVGLELLSELDPIDAVSQRRADLGIVINRTCPRRMTGVRVASMSQARYVRRGADSTRRLVWGREMQLALPGQWTGANAADDETTGAAGFNDFAQLKRAVLEGMGAASLWCFVGDREPELVRITGPEPRWNSALWLLHRASAPVHEDMAALIGFLQPRLRERAMGRS